MRGWLWGQWRRFTSQKHMGEWGRSACLTLVLCLSLVLLAWLYGLHTQRETAWSWAWRLEPEARTPRTIPLSVTSNPCPQRMTIRMHVSSSLSSEGSTRSLPGNSWPQACVHGLKPNCLLNVWFLKKDESVRFSWVDSVWRKSNPLLRNRLYPSI